MKTTVLDHTTLNKSKKEIIKAIKTAKVLELKPNSIETKKGEEEYKEFMEVETQNEEFERLTEDQEMFQTDQVNELMIQVNEAKQANEEILSQYEDLSSKFTLLMSNFEELKAKQPQEKRKLTFEETAELYRQKAILLNKIGKFDQLKEKVLSADLKQNNDNPLESDQYSLSLKWGERDYFNVKNLIVIDEFLNFVLVKIETKIEELKEELANI